MTNSTLLMKRKNSSISIDTDIDEINNEDYKPINEISKVSTFMLYVTVLNGYGMEFYYGQEYNLNTDYIVSGVAYNPISEKDENNFFLQKFFVKNSDSNDTTNLEKMYNLEIPQCVPLRYIQKRLNNESIFGFLLKYFLLKETSIDNTKVSQFEVARILAHIYSTEIVYAKNRMKKNNV